MEYGKYFPVGQRGVAFARGAGYGYLEHAKEILMIILQHVTVKLF